MGSAKIEAAFLIYNVERNIFNNSGKSNVIKDINRRINKYASVILSSNYKHVNNFSYTTDIFHYFYKIVECYIFKYFNSIIIDSIFVFKCINDLKNKSLYVDELVEKQNTTNYDSSDVEKKEVVKLKGEDKKTNENELIDYDFDHTILNNFVESLKELHKANYENFLGLKEKNKGVRKKKKQIKQSCNINDSKTSTKTYAKKDESCEDTSKGVCDVVICNKFSKSFLYELCEIPSSFNNREKRMIYITKIFRKIINRSKIRQFICENDKKKKSNHLKYFLNLSFGIFIYLYLYKHTIKHYKNVNFFIFLNNIENIKKIYTNNVPYITKEQIINFLKYIKTLNIENFQYIYISFFVNIYKYVRVIYNITLLTLYTYLVEIRQNQDQNKLLLGEQNEIIFDCYVYVFIFFTYIRHIKKHVKSNIIKIQNYIKKIILSFISIYNINKMGEKSDNDDKKGVCINLTTESEIFSHIKDNKNCNSKKDNHDENSYGDNISFNKENANIFTLLYKHYLTLSKHYKQCIKLNYQIIQHVYVFHTLLKHFYKYFPILKKKKKKNTYIIYNYYNKSYIYNEQWTRENDKKKNENDEQKKHCDKKEKTFDIFQNVNEYELDFFYFSEKKNDEKEIINDLIEDNEMESFDYLFSFKDTKTELSSYNSLQGDIAPMDINQTHIEQAYTKQQQIDDDNKNSITGLDNDPSEKLKQMFLYCINNDLDDFLINVDTDKVPESSNIQTGDKEKNEENTSSIYENVNTNFLKISNTLKILKKNKNIYKSIMTIIEKICNNKLPFIQNYINDLNIYNKNILNIYDNHIFDSYYKFYKNNIPESDESIKNRTLLEVKIFLDYEKLYTKRTVETQTPISLYKNDTTTQIGKDQGVSTVSKQYTQSTKFTNPIFYLESIYD
ncbi:conserved protein, unknown function [Hepatocystis sp. ex Piliocolobus tephrosceles]|nr:conserved protein, unknown function [Hepatocystis sp. ex Piliocolobus tephrosceles]